jgi:uncharacterized membrane protein
MMTTAPIPANTIASKNFYRVETIDLLRGLIMIIMALDHVRDYFHADAMIYDPTDLTKTNTLLFFTRWITHICAPLFMFLSGTSAYLSGRKKGKKALAKFLLTRGLWLILLEFTVVNFGWYFNIHFNSIDFLVIWALGISMVFLAGFIFLPLPWITGISLAMVFGHNLLDTVHVSGGGAASFGWALLHEQTFFPFEKVTVLVAYPIIPWIGVMALGYCLGKLFGQEVNPAFRKKWLTIMGAACIIVFILVRYSNAYGDPSPWSSQPTPHFTLLSFLSVSKYPPSLLYLLITVGPGLLFLAFMEGKRSVIFDKIRVIGRVPMFYYLVHLYLIHLIALFATYFCGKTPNDMILTGWIAFEPKLKGYGFSLGVTYAVWFCVIVILYFLCRWYDRYKSTHRQWWLSYL